MVSVFRIIFTIWQLKVEPAASILATGQKRSSILRSGCIPFRNVEALFRALQRSAHDSLPPLHPKSGVP
jgi:hypothetical protein